MQTAVPPAGLWQVIPVGQLPSPLQPMRQDHGTEDPVASETSWQRGMPAPVHPWRHARSPLAGGWVSVPVPHTPELVLHVADEATELWQRTEEELGEIGLPPPFWAFAWAGGQALARYILDHPETVNGRRVLDFASGSGLVAIAAMNCYKVRGM